MGEPGQAGDPRAPRDGARRHPRHVRGAGHPDRDRRHDLARRRRRPPDGQAVDRRRRRAGDRRSREAVPRRRQDREGRGLHLVRRPERRSEARARSRRSRARSCRCVNESLDAKKSDIYQRFEKLLSWADKFRRLGVRANADLPDQAELAYAFGARGIGLCRTEHMFFGEGRIPIVQRMILADNEADRREGARQAAAAAARRLLRRLQGACRARPVTIRTIDPPLHEFLPKREDLMVDVARLETARQEGQGARGEEEAAGPRRAAARVQPDARPSRRASRDHLSRDHRDADARDHRGRLPPEQGRHRRSCPRS